MAKLVAKAMAIEHGAETTAMIARADILGVVLAGGQSRRMGGADKCLAALAGRPLLAHVIERAAPQVDGLLLNANGDGARFDAFALTTVADVVAGYAGPLAGVLTGLEWAAREAPHYGWVATFAADAPFVPYDLVACMARAIATDGADMACATSAGRAHPVFGLWPVGLHGALRSALVDEDVRKVDRWTARYRLAQVDFESPAGDVDPFFNINTPDDLARAAHLVRPGP